MIEPAHQWNRSLKPLVLGLGLSLPLVFLTYFTQAWGWLFALAIAQGLVQLVCFLHLGIEKKPRWNLLIFAFMLFIMLVIVGGTMWIMRNLDYYLMVV